MSRYIGLSPPQFSQFRTFLVEFCVFTLETWPSIVRHCVHTAAPRESTDPQLFQIRKAISGVLRPRVFHFIASQASKDITGPFLTPAAHGIAHLFSRAPLFISFSSIWIRWPGSNIRSSYAKVNLARLQCQFHLRRVFEYSFQNPSPLTSRLGRFNSI